MLVLSADVRRAIAATLARDRAAHLAVESAAALHLGRPLALPVVIATRIESDAALLRLIPPTSGRPTTVMVDGLRASNLEATIVELCARPTQPLSLPLAAELMQRTSVLEGRGYAPASLVRAARHATAAARRRVCWLLARAGEGTIAANALPTKRSGVVKLDPLGPSGGPVDGRFRLTLNVADGFPGATDALVAHARAVLGASLDELACVVELGFSVPEADPHALSRGWLIRDGDGYRLRAPFDEVCRQIATSLDARARRSVLSRLSRSDHPLEQIDAALLQPTPKRGATALQRAELSRSIERVSDAARARAVVDRLGAHLEPDLLRRFLERIGAYADAAALVRNSLTRVRGRARHELLIAAAQLAWRRARPREALSRLDELEGGRPGPALSIEAHLLRATLAAESGAHARAERLLTAAMRAAERAGRDHDRARALHRLGTIAARRGRPLEANAAYRAALEALGPKTAATRALFGILESNLASTASWLGRWDEAEELGRAALADKTIAGTHAEVLSTKVLLARIARARGTPLPPGGRVAPLLGDVERTGDARLAVEAYLDLAEELGRDGDLLGAARALERARVALVSLDASEPILVSLVAHVDGVLRGLSGDREGALRALVETARALDRQHGAYWAARARREAASIADLLGRTSQALSLLRTVAEASIEHRFVLGEDRVHVALYALGALGDDGVARRFSEHALASIGALDVRTRLRELGLHERAEALRGRSAGTPRHPVARVLAPHGVRLVDAPERARLLRGVPDTIVLDDSGPGLVRPDGVRVDLGRRRVLVPLLRALGARAGDPLSLDELARTLWERRDASARAAVKMSVSRLRDLLGPLGDGVVAVRASGVAAYQLRFPLWIVEPL